MVNNYFYGNGEWNPFLQGCVSVSVGKEVCLVSDSSSSRYGSPRSCRDEIHPLSPKTYTYNLLPLELGLHPIIFTLLASKREIVIKNLRVVVGASLENSSPFSPKLHKHILLMWIHPATNQPKVNWSYDKTIHKQRWPSVKVHIEIFSGPRGVSSCSYVQIS